MKSRAPYTIRQVRYDTLRRQMLEAADRGASCGEIARMTGLPWWLIGRLVLMARAEIEA